MELAKPAEPTLEGGEKKRFGSRGDIRYFVPVPLKGYILATKERKCYKCGAEKVPFFQVHLIQLSEESPINFIAGFCEKCRDATELALEKVLLTWKRDYTFAEDGTILSEEISHPTTQLQPPEGYRPLIKKKSAPVSQ